jgi:hypothetical protein
MPIRKSRLSKLEAKEYRSRLSKLERMGIPIERTCEPFSNNDRLDIQQSDVEFAKIYELPLSEIAVVVPARITVRIGGMLITDFEMTVPWDGCDFDLSDARESSWYQEVLRELPYFPRVVLNHWLKQDVPLRPRQPEGFLIVHGYGVIPPSYHDDASVVVKLSLEDEQYVQHRFDFNVRVDRSMKRRYEQRAQKRIDGTALSRRGGLYDGQEPESAEQNIVPDIGHQSVGIEGQARANLRRKNSVNLSKTP